ncbi:MAG: hypothetical protein WCS70_09075 [Verrucomicrobiota bacterium]
MSNPWITVADPRDVQSLARDMRACDRQEVAAASGLSPNNGLLISMARSPRCWAAIDAQGTFAMWGVGVASSLATEGSPWLLGADRLVTDHRQLFVRRSREFVTWMRQEYVVLRNYVDARNTASLRWLKWCGFDILPAEPYGVAKLPFHPFYMRTSA